MLGLTEQALQETAAKIERQRGTVLELLGQVGQLSDEITALRADNERLRAALFAIYKAGLFSQGGAYKSGFYSNFKIARRALGIPHMAFDQARAALAQKEKADVAV